MRRRLFLCITHLGLKDQIKPDLIQSFPLDWVLSSWSALGELRQYLFRLHSSVISIGGCPRGNDLHRGRYKGATSKGGGPSQRPLWDWAPVRDLWESRIQPGTSAGAGLSQLSQLEQAQRQRPQQEEVSTSDLYWSRAGTRALPLREQAWARELCGTGHEAATSEVEGLSQGPLPVQIQGNDLYRSRDKEAMPEEAGLSQSPLWAWA